MQSRSETYILTNGTGRFRLRGGNGTAAYGFFVGEQPILFQYDPLWGTVADAFWHFAAVEMGIPDSDLRIIVAREPDEERSLAEQILPLLRQFANGEYTLAFGELPEDWELMQGAADEETYNEFYSGYDTLYLFSTQPSSALDPTNVDECKRRIEQGECLWAITANVGWNSEIILDGHHKIAAYNELMQTPLRLVIRPPLLADLTFDDWPTEQVGFISQTWFNVFLQSEQDQIKKVPNDIETLRKSVRWQIVR